MRRSIPYVIYLIILSSILTGCSLSLPPPSPVTLLGTFTEPFLCGFTAYDGSAEPYRASLARDLTADTLTVYGEYTDTVLYCDGASLMLLTDENEEAPPLKLPLPDGHTEGIAAFLQLFSVMGDDSFTSVRTDSGIVVCNADSTYSAVFSEDGTPCRISLGDLSVIIDSFSKTAHPTP